MSVCTDRQCVHGAVSVVTALRRSVSMQRWREFFVSICTDRQCVPDAVWAVMALRCSVSFLQ